MHGPFARIKWGIRPAVAFAVLSLLANARVQAQSYAAQDLYMLTAPPNDGDGNGTNAAGGQMAGFAVYPVFPYFTHAVYWNSSGTPIDLNPAGFMDSNANATDGVNQVGGGANDGLGYPSHAFLWSGSASSVVDLNPPDFGYSAAYGVYGNQQVGAAAVSAVNPPSQTVAMVWNSTANSATNLNPSFNPANASSVAYATDGVQQVGQANHQAVIWSGTAATAVVLTQPARFSTTVADSVVPGQEAGYGYNALTDTENALVWTGIAQNLVNLNATGDTGTQAFGTNGSEQVGEGYVTGTDNLQALLWSGTADSQLDLGALLPSNFTWSMALSIDSFGDVYGLALDDNHDEHAVEWIPVPEPTCLSILTMTGALLLRRRHPSIFAR